MERIETPMALEKPMTHGPKYLPGDSRKRDDVHSMFRVNLAGAFCAKLATTQRGGIQTHHWAPLTLQHIVNIKHNNTNADNTNRGLVKLDFVRGEPVGKDLRLGKHVVTRADDGKQIAVKVYAKLDTRRKDAK